MTAQEKVQLIVETVDEMKAEDIEQLHVTDKTSIADYFIICTATNDRQLVAIVDKVAEKMKASGERPIRTEGGTGGWILQDYGDIILHVMRDEQRQFYDLEALWRGAFPNSDMR